MVALAAASIAAAMHIGARLRVRVAQFGSARRARPFREVTVGQPEYGTQIDARKTLNADVAVSGRSRHAEIPNAAFAAATPLREPGVFGLRWAAVMRRSHASWSTQQ